MAIAAARIMSAWPETDAAKQARAKDVAPIQIVRQSA